MINVIKKAKRGLKNDMLFGKKYICFGCGIKTSKVSRMICIKEVGVLGLFYLNGLLCKNCSANVRKQMYEILVEKAYKSNSENSFHIT